jgi:hypothetical protein
MNGARLSGLLWFYQADTTKSYVPKITRLE